MNTMNVTGAIALAAAAVLTAGCGTQSAAFRQMSAADHESASLAQSDPAVAQEHMDAARRLRSDEQSACYHVPDADRLNGPLTADRISSVEVIRDHGVYPKGQVVPVGVRVYLLAEPGLTQEWLGRVVACHMAHLAVTGEQATRSPLAVPGSSVSVSPTGTGFEVTVMSKNTDVARAIVEKGVALVGGTSTY
jgi:hypothetical protein